VVLYDVDPTTLTPDLHSLQRVLRVRPSAVVVVHLFGMPVDLVPIMHMAAEYDTIVIDDAAQAIGATINEKPAGSLGSLGVLSFGRGKGLTSGGGGALLGNDSIGADIVQAIQPLEFAAGWSVLGAAVAQMLLARPNVYGIPARMPFLKLGETVYKAPRPPRGLPRAGAAILGSTWSQSHAASAHRKANADRLMLAARNAGGWHVPTWLPNVSPGFLRLPLRSERRTRDSLLSSDLAAQLGVVSGYPATLAELPALKNRLLQTNERLPGASALAESLITLPTHGLLTSADLLALERWLHQATTST
jgi:dTDP-4-amino-4,6-dideoxygalactose transaminase